MMFTTDLALKVDPIYGPISKRFHENPKAFAEAFAKAWYKLTHRDMGPISRYLGPEVPAEQQIWQDPLPAVDHSPIDEQDVAALKRRILASGLTVPATGGDRVGVGVDLPRHRQARRRERRAHSSWRRRRIGPSTCPANWRRCCRRSKKCASDFNASLSGGKKVSLADVIVLGGCAAIEKAAKDAGVTRQGEVLAGPHRRHAREHRRALVRGARTQVRRLPQLSRPRGRALAGATPARSRASAHAERARDDRARRRPARARRQRRRIETRRLHEAPRHADERLLREPARPERRSGSRTVPTIRTMAATGRPAR